MIPTSNCLGIVTPQSLCHSTRAFAMAARVTNITIIGLAQKNLNAANAKATETAALVDDANAIANADLQAAKNTKNKNAELIKNSADENSTVKDLLAIGAEMAFNRVNRLEYEVGEVATVGIKRNQNDADRVTAAEETVRLLEEMMQFYETKLAELTQFYENLPAKQ